MTNYERRQLIMATANSPAYIQCKVQKMVEKRPLINLSEIVVDEPEDNRTLFEKFMAEGESENDK